MLPPTSTDDAPPCLPKWKKVAGKIGHLLSLFPGLIGYAKNQQAGERTITAV